MFDIKQKWSMKTGFIALCILTIGVAVAANFTLTCAACGNTTTTRGTASQRLLHDTTGLQSIFGQIRRLDTFTIMGGDGSKSKYMLYDIYATIRFGCVLNCGPADNNDGLWLPPANGAGGSGGSGDGGSGGGFGVVGYTPIYRTATVCTGGICRSEQVLVGYNPIYGRTGVS